MINMGCVGSLNGRLGWIQISHPTMVCIRLFAFLSPQFLCQKNTVYQLGKPTPPYHKIYNNTKA